jgi:hypothetical protein
LALFPCVPRSNRSETPNNVTYSQASSRRDFRVGEFAVLGQFLRDLFYQDARSGWKQSHVMEFARTRIDTQASQDWDGIRQRQSRRVQVDTRTYRRFRCRLSLHTREFETAPTSHKALVEHGHLGIASPRLQIFPERWFPESQ